MEAVALSECYWWEKPAANDNVRRGNHLVESDAVGNTITEYIWLGTQRIAMVQGSNLYFTHVDHLGTVQLLTDTNANVVWSAEYKPFGEVVINPGSTVTYNLRFPGQYYDSESGNHYNYFRTYDPSTGRYITADPLGVAGLMNALGFPADENLLGLSFTGQDANLYAYVRNNPQLYIDPHGALIQFGPVIAKALRVAVIVARIFIGPRKPPEPPKLPPTEPPPPTVPVPNPKPPTPPKPTKPPKPPSCPT